MFSNFWILFRSYLYVKCVLYSGGHRRRRGVIQFIFLKIFDQKVDESFHQTTEVFRLCGAKYAVSERHILITRIINILLVPA